MENKDEATEAAWNPKEKERPGEAPGEHLPASQPALSAGHKQGVNIRRAVIGTTRGANHAFWIQGLCQIRYLQRSLPTCSLSLPSLHRPSEKTLLLLMEPNWSVGSFIDQAFLVTLRNSYLLFASKSHLLNVAISKPCVETTSLHPRHGFCNSVTYQWAVLVELVPGRSS